MQSYSKTIKRQSSKKHEENPQVGKTGADEVHNSCLKLSFKVIHELEKGSPIFQTEAHEPYPELDLSLDSFKVKCKKLFLQVQ